jgi:hypothetical protein
MGASRREARHDSSEAAAGPKYEPPALTVIGPMNEFTFGSKNNGNDGNGTKKNP